MTKAWRSVPSFALLGCHDGPHGRASAGGRTLSVLHTVFTLWLNPAIGFVLATVGVCAMICTQYVLRHCPMSKGSPWNISLSVPSPVCYLAAPPSPPAAPSLTHHQTRRRSSDCNFCSPLHVFLVHHVISVQHVAVGRGPFPKIVVGSGWLEVRGMSWQEAESTA